MKLSPSSIRFVFEAAFIVGVAAATAVAHLDELWIGLSVGGAWLLVTLVERAAKQQRTMFAGGLGALLGRRGAEPDARGVAEDAAEHPEPEPTGPVPAPPAPEPAPPAPDPEPPRPEPGQPTPQLRAVPAPEPKLEPNTEPVRQEDGVVAFRPRADGSPREWNVWDLERIAREREGHDPARDDELAFLLLELRQFADADGRLPVSFDPVVREVFGESLYVSV